MLRLGEDAAWHTHHCYHSGHHEFALKQLVGLDLFQVLSLGVVEAIPQLVQFLDDDFIWSDQVNESLASIVGYDLGEDPKAWLEWYRRRQP